MWAHIYIYIFKKYIPVPSVISRVWDLKGLGSLDGSAATHNLRRATPRRRVFVLFGLPNRGRADFVQGPVGGALGWPTSADISGNGTHPRTSMKDSHGN